MSCMYFRMIPAVIEFWDDQQSREPVFCLFKAILKPAELQHCAMLFLLLVFIINLFVILPCPYLLVFIYNIVYINGGSRRSDSPQFS